MYLISHEHKYIFEEVACACSILRDVEMFDWVRSLSLGYSKLLSFRIILVLWWLIKIEELYENEIWWRLIQMNGSKRYAYGLIKRSLVNKLNSGHMDQQNSNVYG